ncbi:MAG: ATP-binding protein [Bacteroidales bacterium]
MSTAMLGTRLARLAERSARQGIARGPRLRRVAWLCTLVAAHLLVLASAGASAQTPTNGTGAAVVYRGQSFWTVHAGWVIATLLLVVGQTILIGMMLAQRRKRNSLQASLKARLRFETILSDVSTALGGVAVVRVDAAVRAAIGMIRRYLALDRVSLFELSEDGTIVRTADDAAPGSPPVPDAYVIAELPSITLTLAALQPFVVERVENLPPEAEREREVLVNAGIRSLALVPLEVGGRGLGALSCVSHARERTWPADVLQQVRTLGQVLASVIQRRQTDAAVAESDRLKGAILSSIPAHITVLDRQGVIIAVNDAWMAYARANGVRSEASIAPGANYLEVCERAAAAGAPGAADALAGIRAVCERRSDSFQCEYACHGARDERWFGMRVMALKRPEGGALVTHWDITSEKRQELALRELTGRLLNAQEDERRRIARELHDDLQQRLALLAIELDGIALGHAELAPEHIADRARDLWRQANEISTELHNLSHRLHPTRLEALGLLATVQGYCRELSKLGLKVTFKHHAVPTLVPPDVALCVFRIVQESLQNVMKHSGASEAGVTMSADGQRLELVVSDSGRGFDVTGALNTGGLGLVSMRERLHLVGGTMRIRSVPGRGTDVEFRVPLRADDSAAPQGATLQGTGIPT